MKGIKELLYVLGSILCATIVAMGCGYVLSPFLDSGTNLGVSFMIGALIFVLIGRPDKP